MKKKAGSTKQAKKTVTKRKVAAKRVARRKTNPDGLAPLVAEVRALIKSARRGIASVVDTFQVLTNFEIGRRIVEHEQKGAKRAIYGAELLKKLSIELTSEFGAGFSERNLRSFRLFYQTYEKNVPKIWQTPSAKLRSVKNRQTVSAELNVQKKGRTAIDQTPSVQKQWAISRDLASAGITQAGSGESRIPFTLSWSHYVLLLTIKNADERSFYEVEATNERWSLSELKRQKVSCLYERLALSRDKDGIRRLAKEGQIITRPDELFKEPVVLEFLGLQEQTYYSETDLESAIISQLEKFLLELGKGFLFEARQKRFTFDGDHYFLDLVFYNRLLRCYVVIDLKLDKLTHQDLGQMQMYVNYYDREVKLPDENPTVGLLLCKERKDTIVKLTLPKETNIHAKEYQLYLPSKELLQRKLLEWTRQEKARRA